jgi:hypothetical protein
MDTETRHELINRLANIAHNGPCDTSSGICDNICMNDFDGVYPWLWSQFKTWEHFSGDIAYPVSTARFHHDTDPYPTIARDEYIFNSAWHSMWEGEYGRLRYDLLRHLLMELAR